MTRTVASISNPQPGFRARVREALTLGTIIAIALAVALTVYSVIDATADFYGDQVWANFMLAGRRSSSRSAPSSSPGREGNGCGAAAVAGPRLITTVLGSLAFTITVPLVTVQYGKGGFQYWLEDG